MTTKRLFIVLGFKNKPLRDTLADTAKEAKIRCVNSLLIEHPDIDWSGVRSWGWRCVPVFLYFKTLRRNLR